MVRKLLQKGVVPMMVIAVMAVILAIGGGTYYFVSQKIKKAAQISNFEECAKAGYPVLQTYPAECKTPDGRVFSEAEQNNSSSSRIDFSNFNPKFRFSATVPSEWLVEYIPQIAAVNIYNPNASAGTALDKSEIFIRYFESDGFLTLATVDFYGKTAATIMGHDAMRYEIQKKSGVPDYAYQPGWRGKRHKLTDIRFSKSSPSLFYVFAYDPALSEAKYNNFINSVEFHNDKKSLRSPIDDALSRVTKKPYGLKISPQDSPVKPERFNGIHTGADFEIFSGEEEKDISEIDIVKDWDIIKVKITKGGLANIFFEKDFKANASMRGIGWVVLYYDPLSKKLFNVWINEHDVGHLSGCIPILVLDVFEHAYMVDYGLKKVDYIEAFFKAIDWDIIAKRF